ncbi:MAG: co-chaperone GroES [Sulfurimonas sp.]|nr:co-chaperone GroES [Sulfurimonas sp.]
MNFQPLGKRVLVKRVEEATTTMSGIIIPDNAQEKPSRGEVVAVSKEVTELVNGNQVLFGKYAGNEVSFEGTKYMVLEVDDIFGIIGK